MEGLVEAGITKSIGVSDFNSSQIETLMKTARIKPVTNQVESHPFLPQEELLGTCSKYGIVMTAYSPLGGSPVPPISTFTGMELPNLKEKLFENDIVKRLAAKYEKSPSQILLKFHVARGVAVIPKSVTDERIKQNIQLFDFELLPEELNDLKSLETGHRLFKMQGLERSKYYPF